MLKSTVDYETFNHDEKIFYKNQSLQSRHGYISDKVDTEYEALIVERQGSMKKWKLIISCMKQKE